MTIRVGINGFGRTGRALFRAAQRHDLGMEIVGINDLGSPESLARLLARDSVYGRFGQTVTTSGNVLVVGGHRILLPTHHEIKGLPWAKLEVDVVVEATGRFTSRQDAAAHLEAGAPRVVVSAPSEGADATFVMGVNDDTFDPARHLVVSNASCTSNCLAVLAKVLDDAFGLEDGFMTTVHAYTGDQQLVDGLHTDPRRARAAALNIVPTSTGATRTVGLVLPALAGRLGGLALRVPVPDGSITDLVANVASKVTVAHVHEAFREAAAAGPLAGVLEYCEEPLTSTDIVGSPASCIYDAELTQARGRLVKVLGWYDNEWGYANRLAELAAKVGAAPIRTSAGGSSG